MVFVGTLLETSSSFVVLPVVMCALGLATVRWLLVVNADSILWIFCSLLSSSVLPMHKQTNKNMKRSSFFFCFLWINRSFIIFSFLSIVLYHFSAICVIFELLLLTPTEILFSLESFSLVAHMLLRFWSLFIISHALGRDCANCRSTRSPPAMRTIDLWFVRRWSSSFICDDGEYHASSRIRLLFYSKYYYYYSNVIYRVFVFTFSENLDLFQSFA